MPSPSDAKPATPQTAQRPSLLGDTAPAKRSTSSAQDAEPSGFDVSILSAIADNPRGKRALPAKPTSARKNNWMWWLGIGVIAVGLLGAAQWQRSQAAAPDSRRVTAANPNTKAAVAALKADPLTEAPVVVAIEPREISNSPSGGLIEVAAAASSPFSALDPEAGARPPTSTHSAAAAAGPEKPSAAGKASQSPPERKANSQRDTQARTQGPATSKSTIAKDADAELLAALMAHSDGARAAAKIKVSPLQPISEVERRRFSTKLRECRSKGNSTAREDCRMAACQAANYWGRTKSCPASGANALPSRAAAS
jgi:hypothetical protein